MARLNSRRSPGAGSGDGNQRVGYRSPPKETRFKKGESGNPHGSSKKVRARKAIREMSPFDQIMLDESGRVVPITENGERTEVSVYQAANRSLMLQAAKGDRQAQRLVIEQVQAAHDRTQAAATERFGLLVHYHTNGIIARSGPMPPEPHEPRYWPHPDDVLLDYRKCIGEVVGPIDPHQAAPFIELVDEYRIWEARLTWLEGHDSGALHAIHRAVSTAIAALLDRIRRHLPPSFRRALDQCDEDAAAGALEVEGSSGIVDLALVAPDSDEMTCCLYRLFSDAGAAADTVRWRTRLNIADNTASLINRVRIERKAADSGVASAPPVPEFGQFYEGFAANDPGIDDEAQA